MIAGFHFSQKPSLDCFASSLRSCAAAPFVFKIKRNLILRGEYPMEIRL